MLAVVKEFTVTATPEKVFAALTQQDQLARWWTDELSVKPEVGSLAEFRFRQGAFVIQVDVAELDTNKKVVWTARPTTWGWEGTTVTWTLTPVADGTQVLFNHEGFAQDNEAYRMVNGIWKFFLGSLESYLNTGTGTPGFPANFS